MPFGPVGLFSYAFPLMSLNFYIVEQQKSKLIAHLHEFSVKTGDFTLKSGLKSSWFCDVKQSACRPEGIRLIADLALKELPEEVIAIGGLAAGADPVAFGLAGIAAERDRDLRSFSIRKEAKDHGVTGRLSGVLEPGDTVAIVEDTATRGTSALEAARIVQELGAQPVLILAVVDRGGVCGKLASDMGLDFKALITALDLGFDYES